MKTIAFIFFISLLCSCSSHVNNIGEITVVENTTKKKQKKTHEQFIQIAYIDLFNQTISPQRLASTKNVFDSQEDDDINYQLFIKMLVKEAAAQLPPDRQIRENPRKFIEECYLKFYGRYPNGYEEKKLIQFFSNDPKITVGKFYYILMTSEEYRFF